MIQFCRTITVHLFGESCIEEFLDWTQSLTRTNHPSITRKVICIAHNLKGYDSYFILEQFYKQYVKPDQLVNGAKILSMSVTDLRFLDSMSFLRLGWKAARRIRPPIGYCMPKDTRDDGAKQWSRGVKVLYGESAEEQERVAEELGVEVDVKEDDSCARKPWIDMGKTVCLSGGGREPRRL